MRRLQGAGLGLQGIKQHGFLAFAGAGQHHHRTLQASAPRPAQFQHGTGRLGVKFQITQHAQDRRTHLAQTLCIGITLGPCTTQGCISRPGQARPTQGQTVRALVHAGVDQQQGHTGLGAGSRQVGPDLGFHQHPHTWLKVVQKSIHCSRGVPRQPCLLIARLKQALPKRAPSGGAVGEQQAQTRVLGAQGIDQHSRHMGLTQGYRMHP